MDYPYFFEQLHTVSLGRNLAHFSALDSTSSYIRRMLAVCPAGFTAVADGQTAGRGRTGKSFYSPKDDGLYFSFLITDERAVNDPLFTVKLSYALCKAVDSVTGTESVGIKWVNDLYIGEKKLAGILCEAVTAGEKKGVIVGVGINLTVDKGAVPQELRSRIGSLRDVTKKRVRRETLLAAILNETEALYAAPLSKEAFLDAYRARSVILGREINVVKEGLELRAAALDIDENGALAVRYATGFTEKLACGEVSIIPV